ncbi:MAG: hypothetical protein NT084_14165 [Bacteroidetes bacterium]|nr:hypothetical protein [Bacteroidota bacterium]
MKVRSRFSYFRDKLQVFFLGLLFGLVLGGGFFVLKLDQYVRELSFYKSLTEKKDQNDLVTVDTKTETEKPVVKKNKKENSVSYRSDSTTKSSSSMDLDTSTSVVSRGNTNENGTTFVVRKDEMLAEKTYSAQIIANKKAGDSTAIKENPSTVDVEFWKSPLNYHGYKFSRNKLVLFGFGDQDLVSVFKMENETFLKCLTGVFRVEPTTEFHQLERVTDESLLSKIK